MHIVSFAIQSSFSNYTLQLCDYRFSRSERTNVGLTHRSEEFRDFTIWSFISRLVSRCRWKEVAGTTIIGITRNIHGTRGGRDTLHSGSLRQHRTNVAEISMLRICIAKIRDGQFVTFSNAFASDSRVARVIRDGGFSPLSPPRSSSARLNLTYHCPTAWKRVIQFGTVQWRDGGYVWLWVSCGTNAGNCQSLLVRGETKRGPRS